MATFDFSHLENFKVKESRTSRIELHEISAGSDSVPWFELKFAGESNRAYQSAISKLTARHTRDIQRLQKRKEADKLAKMYRDDDREVYPKAVVVGWGNIFDSQGDEVPFSVEACVAFLNALPDWVFDILRDHAASISNFLDESRQEVDDEDAADLGNFSETGSSGI